MVPGRSFEVHGQRTRRKSRISAGRWLFAAAFWVPVDARTPPRRPPLSFQSLLEPAPERRQVLNRACPPWGIPGAAIHGTEHTTRKSLGTRKAIKNRARSKRGVGGFIEQFTNPIRKLRLAYRLL
jgi:hypothetical protein